MCVGYPDGSLKEHTLLSHIAKGRSGVENINAFPMDLYCNKCVVDPDKIVSAIAEQELVAQFLNDPTNNFRLERVPGDGYCIFRILEDFAKQHLE